MHVQSLQVSGTSTYSSTVSQITSFAVDFFKSKFPTNYFKHTHISTSLNSINLQDTENTEKYKLPALAVTPSMSNDSTFMERLPYTYRPFHQVRRNEYHSEYYNRVLIDGEHLVSIYAIPTRVKVNFAINIKLQTVLQMYDLLQYIENNFETTGIEFVNNTRMEAEIPKAIMLNMGKNLGYKMDDIDQQRLFDEYLKRYSYQTITSGVNVSTGNRKYSYRYLTNMMIDYPDAPNGSANTNNLSVDSTTVEFSFGVECWVPNIFLLNTPESYEIDYEILDDDDKFYYNTVLDVDYIKQRLDNMSLITQKKFIPEVNTEVDTLSYAPVLQYEIRKIIQTLHELDMDKHIPEILKIKVMCGNKLLHDVLYDVDYVRHIIHTKQPMSNTTYMILVYGDLKYLNEISELIRNKKVDQIELLWRSDNYKNDTYAHYLNEFGISVNEDPKENKQY